MNIIMGPILKFNGLFEDLWNISALIVVKGNEKPNFSWSSNDGNSGTAQAICLIKKTECVVWRFEWAVAQIPKNNHVSYKIGDCKWGFVVPGKGTPLRFAYASCNGFANRKDMKKVAEPNERWVDLSNKHKQKPFHVLLLGGDQVYADPIWETVELLVEWLDKPESKRINEPFSKKMTKAVESFYFELYCNRWAQDGPREMFSSIPTLMMWDDHDIFDGWGSYPELVNQCPVYRGIFDIALANFRLFQLQIQPQEIPKTSAVKNRGFLSLKTGLSYGYTIGSTGLLTLDTRSERTQDTIISLKSWNAIFQWMDQLQDLKHLLVMTGIPVVYPNYSTIETALRLLPGRQDLEDDLLDHWRSRSHRTERLRLIHRLLKFSKQKTCRVTIISGDVHLAAIGIIESKRIDNTNSNAGTINQLVSSPIVNLPQPRVSRFYLDWLARKVEKVDRGITARMVEFPGTEERFINYRNWLSLTYDDADRIWAEWNVEGEELPYSKVIHSVEK